MFKIKTCAFKKKKRKKKKKKKATSNDELNTSTARV